MAEIATTTTTTKKTPKHQTHRRNSCLISCFGNFSDGDERYLPEIIDSPSNKKKSRWFSSAKFRLKKSFKETISVCNPPIFKKNRKQIRDVKSDDRKVITTGDKHQIPVTKDSKPVRFFAATCCASDQNVDAQNPKKVKLVANLNTSIDHFDKAEGLNCHKHTTDRKSIIFSSQPNQSVKRSLSQEKLVSRQHSSIDRFPIVGNNSDGEIAGKFGPVTGISVLIVTLMVMLIWGRIFAIFSTAAWLYFVHYFKTMTKTKKIVDKSNWVNMNFDSKEYRKKVILEGLLERKHMWSLK